MDMKNRDWEKWIKCAGVRAVKTVAQTAVGAIGGAVILSSVDWRVVASTAALAGVLSLLTSVAGYARVFPCSAV